MSRIGISAPVPAPTTPGGGGVAPVRKHPDPSLPRPRMSSRGAERKSTYGMNSHVYPMFRSSCGARTRCKPSLREGSVRPKDGPAWSVCLPTRHQRARVLRSRVTHLPYDEVEEAVMTGTRRHATLTNVDLLPPVPPRRSRTPTLEPGDELLSVYNVLRHHRDPEQRRATQFGSRAPPKQRRLQARKVCDWAVSCHSMKRSLQSPMASSVAPYSRTHPCTPSGCASQSERTLSIASGSAPRRSRSCG